MYLKIMGTHPLNVQVSYLLYGKTGSYQRKIIDYFFSAEGLFIISFTARKCLLVLFPLPFKCYKNVSTEENSILTWCKQTALEHWERNKMKEVFLRFDI